MALLPRSRRLRRPACPGLRRGAAAVEFAVVACLLFPMVLGIIEIGRGLMVVHVLTAAACRGCRTAVVEGRTQTDVDTAVQQLLSSSGISGETITILVNNVSGDPAKANAGDEITVKVSVPVSQVSWVPVTRYLTSNLSAQYTLTRE
jgi:Flp pilus assembly protein TadG